MELTTIIDPKTITPHMQAVDKADALKQLVNLLAETGYVTDVEGFLKDIYLREAEGMTGIGNYIAIPHGKSAHVQTIGVAIGVLDEEIPWETLDENGVKGIILFAVGNDTESAQEHLKMLSLFARKLGKDEVVDSLLNATTTDEIINAFQI